MSLKVQPLVGLISSFLRSYVHAPVRAIIVGWLFSVVLLVLVTPGQAQAHGLHEHAVPYAQGSQTSDPVVAENADLLENTAADCVTCCATSSCFSVAVIDASSMVAPERPGRLGTYLTDIPAYEAALRRLGRPPKHTS